MKLNMKDKGKSGIYVIINLLNDKKYIGKAKCLYRRIKDHITRLNTKDENENCHLINSWHKYGKNNFKYEVLEYCDLEVISEKELFWIETLDTLNREKGYNLRLDSSTGMIASEETKKKYSMAQKKRYSNPEEREKVSQQFKNFWRNNPDKLKIMAEKIAQINIKYKILQFDKKTNELIKEWSSIREVMKSNPQYKQHNIYAVMSGEKPSMYGYIWRKVKI
mgnify:CR=1 FL=1